ncbi:unnamed protein product, partial [Allacma fusca]
FLVGLALVSATIAFPHPFEDADISAHQYKDNLTVPLPQSEG